MVKFSERLYLSKFNALIPVCILLLHFFNSHYLACFCVCSFVYCSKSSISQGFYCLVFLHDYHYNLSSHYFLIETIEKSNWQIHAFWNLIIRYHKGKNVKIFDVLYLSKFIWVLSGCFDWLSNFRLVTDLSRLGGCRELLNSFFFDLLCSLFSWFLSNYFLYYLDDRLVNSFLFNLIISLSFCRCFNNLAICFYQGLLLINLLSFFFSFFIYGSLFSTLLNSLISNLLNRLFFNFLSNFLYGLCLSGNLFYGFFYYLLSGFFDFFLHCFLLCFFSILFNNFLNGLFSCLFSSLFYRLLVCLLNNLFFLN